MVTFTSARRKGKTKLWQRTIHCTAMRNTESWEPRVKRVPEMLHTTADWNHDACLWFSKVIPTCKCRVMSGAGLSLHCTVWHALICQPRGGGSNLCCWIDNFEFPVCKQLFGNCNLHVWLTFKVPQYFQSTAVLSKYVLTGMVEKQVKMSVTIIIM